MCRMASACDHSNAPDRCFGKCYRPNLLAIDRGKAINRRQLLSTAKAALASALGAR
jgi:hypothetical protein